MRKKIKIQKFAFLIAAIYGMTAILLAAAGAHLFTIERGSVSYLLFNNAVIYQLLHAILILWLSQFKKPNFLLKSTIVSMILGVMFFSGGLYIFIILGKTSLSWITPIGGSLLILGWLNLCILGFKNYFTKN